jgi:hypothetical protein
VTASAKVDPETRLLRRLRHSRTRKYDGLEH